MNFEPAVIKDANQVLKYLVVHMSVNFLDVMKEALWASEYDHNYKILKKNLQNAGLDTAAGAIASGTGIIKEEVLGGERGQQAIQALKKSGRLQQCGRGRGKCLVILNSTLLPIDEAEEGQEQPAEANDEEEQEVVDANNVPSLLRCVRDNYREVERQLRESRRNETHLSKLIEELQEQVNEKNNQITELENNAQIKAVATWQ